MVFLCRRDFAKWWSHCWRIRFWQHSFIFMATLKKNGKVTCRCCHHRVNWKWYKTVNKVKILKIYCHGPKVCLRRRTKFRRASQEIGAFLDEKVILFHKMCIYSKNKAIMEESTTKAVHLPCTHTPFNWGHCTGKLIHKWHILDEHCICFTFRLVYVFVGAQKHVFFPMMHIYILVFYLLSVPSVVL